MAPSLLRQGTNLGVEKLQWALSLELWGFRRPFVVAEQHIESLNWYH